MTNILSFIISMSIVVIILCFVTFTYGSSSTYRDQHERETEHAERRLERSRSTWRHLTAVQNDQLIMWRRLWRPHALPWHMRTFLISSCACANDIRLRNKHCNMTWVSRSVQTKILWAVKVPCWTFVTVIVTVTSLRAQRRQNSLWRASFFENFLRGEGAQTP